MAGFFSLGGRGGPQNKNEQEEEEEREPNNNNSNTQFLFRNEEIYNKGFEIWPQSYHNQNLNYNYYTFGVGPSSSSRRNSSSSNVAAAADDVVSVSDDSTRFGFTVMRSGGGSGLGGGGGAGMNCQDCGNQAKKDCPHLRCRTCCKSRGFQCQTHVKSTWVPAAKRRERQQQLASLQQQHEPQQPQQQQFWGHHSNSRRHRENQGAGAGPLACASLPVTTTGLELGQFPPELNSSAVFRCVKVSPLDAPDERYAYQTAVNIGGHVFKGILYDQGPDSPYTSGAAAGEGSSGGGGSGGGDAQQLTLTTTANPFDHSSQLYPPPLNVFMAGTQFFPPRS